MIRFLVLAFLFYIFFLIVNSVLNAFFGMRKRRSSTGTPEKNANTPPKPQVKYTDVEDAKFEDIPQSKPQEPPNQN